MNEPQVITLPGDRLHLHHGPIDLIIGGEGPGRAEAFAKATRRFQTILTELVTELDSLRQKAGTCRLSGPTARRMNSACTPFSDEHFITPMAAVAGAVADEILAASLDGADMTKFYVNNGGDVAFHLSPGSSVQVAGSDGPITIRHEDPARGIATSGWRGRSMSLGIADAITVLADCAAAADAAATLIANAVDLPGHPAVVREPASNREPAPELDARMVTKDVGPLTAAETASALQNGVERAQRLLERGAVIAVQLSLNGQVRALQ